MTRPVDETEGRIAREVREEAAARDRRVKIGLLLVSVATLFLLVAAALRENVFTEWRAHQRAYGRILEAKADDERGTLLAERYRVEMRQVVLPELGTIDRCVSCHNGLDDPRMIEAPQPHTTHPGEYLRDHEMGRFGCTICHRGQGRAMEFGQAKSEDEHWDWPLLPTEFVQSSCGLCHPPEEVAARGGEVFADGAVLFESKGCRSCHRLNGRGGNLGPELDNEGRKVRGELPMAAVEGPHTLPQWLIEHFENPGRIVEGSRMPSPGLSPYELRSLTTYMLSLQSARDLPSSYLTPEKHRAVYREAVPGDRSAEELYARFCSRCHDTGTFGRYDDFFGIFVPAIRGESYRGAVEPAYVAANIREGRRGTIMPGWDERAGGLTEEEIRRLTGYLLGREVGDEEWEPRPGPSLAGGNAERGAILFRKNCSGCHGPAGGGGPGPSLDSPVFQRVAGDRFLYATIAGGRKNTAMPAFYAAGAGGLGEEEILDLVRFLRTLGSGSDGGEEEGKLAFDRPRSVPGGATP